MGDDVEVDTLAETENYIAWVSREPDGENVFHFEFGQVTIHFFREEFEEMLGLVEEVIKAYREK
ncbi:MAG: hypothetical protein SNJ59_07025 [Aggregatilineales bacterium]